MNSEISNNAGVPKRIRVLIVDNSASFRGTLGEFLERLPHVEVVGAAKDGEQALTLVARTGPDLVLITAN